MAAAAKMQVEVEGVDDALEKLDLEKLSLEDTVDGTEINPGKSGDESLQVGAELVGDTRVLHRRGSDNNDDMFRIEKHGSKSQQEIRQFEANLNDKEKEDYVKIITRDVVQVSTAKASATKSKAKTTKTKFTSKAKSTSKAKEKLEKTKTTKKSKDQQTAFIRNGDKTRYGLASPPASSHQLEAKESPQPEQEGQCEISPEDEPLFRDNMLLRNLYDTWGLPYSQNLPLVSPLPSSETPLKTYIESNLDPSTKKAVRKIAATKLLVNDWCQLRNAYTVHAGSPRTPPTPAMMRGTLHHAYLEEETHPSAHIERMLDFVSRKAQALQRELKAKAVAAGKDKSMGDENVEDSQRALQLVNEMSTLSREESLANDWANKSIARMFALLTNSKAREIPIHSYMDMNQDRILEPPFDEVDAMNRSILISAIVDLFKFGNPKDPNDLTFVTELRNTLDFECDRDHLGAKPMIDLTKFIAETKRILSGYNCENLSLIISDVKTRGQNSLPNQKSQMDGAKDQTMFYRKFFEILTKDVEFTYNGLITNAKFRYLDIDKPLSPIIVLQMLRLNPDLFYNDFVKLSNGEPIGMELFDEDVKEIKLRKSIEKLNLNTSIKGEEEQQQQQQQQKLYHNSYEFRFDLLFQNPSEFSLICPSNESYLKELDEVGIQEAKDSNTSTPFPYSHYLKPLLKTWKTPPTLRYLAARSSQFFNLFNNFINDSTTVEYHNYKNKQVFEIRHYKHSQQQLDFAVKEACNFWLGRTLPKLPDSKEKCTYCDFRAKCPFALGEADELSNKRKLVGARLRQFLNQPAYSVISW
ncbi:EXO5 [Candida metapsilosis]|uniref:Exonuclease V, mitochondrial n=1 Tax=Candida metapsilosis TaxID=273372 RepID=A0A8H8DEA5_9ASCO|nr:EXO5 [Candida metapsilosis]